MTRRFTENNRVNVVVVVRIISLRLRELLLGLHLSSEFVLTDDISDVDIWMEHWLLRLISSLLRFFSVQEESSVLAAACYTKDEKVKCGELSQTYLNDRAAQGGAQ